PGRRLRAGLSASARGAHRRPREAPGEDPAGALARAQGLAGGGERLSAMSALDAAAIHGRLRTRFGDAIGDLAGTRRDNASATVAPATIVDVCRFMKTEPGLEFDCLSNLSGVDYPKRSVIEVVYHLYSYTHRHVFALKVDASRDNPVVPTVSA